MRERENKVLRERKGTIHTPRGGGDLNNYHGNGNERKEEEHHR